MNDPIDVWFHCWCGNQKININNSRLLFLINDKLRKFKISGLYNSINKIFLVAHNVSPKNDFLFDDLSDLYKKIKIIKIPHPLVGNECDTLNEMISYYKNSNYNANILYVHSKGLSYPENSFIELKMKKWVRYMDLYLIHDWQKNIELLNEYDTTGCFLFEPDELTRKADEPDNRKTYAGHFWWSKSNYIKSLELISKDYQKGRGEFHLLDNNNVKYFNIETPSWPRELDLHKDEVNDEYIFPEAW